MTLPQTQTPNSFLLSHELIHGHRSRRRSPSYASYPQMNSPNFSPRVAPTSLADGRLQPAAPPLAISDPNTPRRICIPASRLPHSTPNVSSASIARALEFFNYAAESKSARSKQTTGKLSRAMRSPTVSMSGIDMLAAIPSLSSWLLSQMMASPPTLRPIRQNIWILCQANRPGLRVISGGSRLSKIMWNYPDSSFMQWRNGRFYGSFSNSL